MNPPGGSTIPGRARGHCGRGGGWNEEELLDITFLGTSASVPTRTRNVSSLALRLPERAEIWLFDCGEGTQHRLLQSTLRSSQISRIFLTHLHGDHLFGLLGLLASLSLAGDVRQIDLYGPPGLGEFVATGLRLSDTRLGYPLTIHVVCSGVIFEDERFTVRCRPLQHRVPTFGYRVDEKPRPGALDAARAAELGVPPGPLYGRLKRGERVELPDGRVVDGAALLGPPEPGRSFAYCADTAYCANAVELARGVDLLVHEATFSSREAELAAVSQHATAAEAARVALEAGARQLVLTHLSARVTQDEGRLAALLAEARAVFPNTILGADLQTISVPRRRPR